MNLSIAHRPWAAEPGQRADRSLHATHQKSAALIPAFSASERRFDESFETSTHAAVIKMMMMTFGRTPVDMFDQVKPVFGGYAITMKDEFKLELTCQELKLAAAASRFTGADNAAVRDANFVFAAFVKRKQLTGGYPDFASALAETLKGEFTLHCLKGMGVSGLAQYVPLQNMVGKDVAGVLDTHYRASALVVDGVKRDHGDPYPVDRGYGYRLFKYTNAVQPLDTAAVSTVAVGLKPKNIWSGFYQGAEGNCVTVSAIKAAMMRFGQNPAGIYTHIGATPSGYEVTMRDGFKLSLSHDELDRATRGSNLRGSDTAMLKDANFLYAVSAKRAQLENNDFRGNQSFEVAMETLNDGEYPGQSLRRLGLSAYVRDSNVAELASGAIGTLADSSHSMAVIGGVLDYYGQRYSLASSEWMNSSYRALKLV